MNRSKIIVNENRNQVSRWHDYKQVWINKWNIICVKVVAIISFTCIIALILINIAFTEGSTHSNDNSTKSDLRFINEVKFKTSSHVAMELSDQNQLIQNDCYIYRCTYWGNKYGCCFNCYKIFVQWISNKINYGYDINNCVGSIMLQLDEVLFDNKIMKKNWLNLNFDIHVAHINIRKCYLEDIEEGAFDDKIFQNTLTLTFSQSQIPYYRKNMFINFKSLSDFAVQDSNLAFPPNPFQEPKSEGIKFEFGVLQNFQNTLKTLQVGRSLKNPEAIRNLTGIVLPVLETIDFQYNENLTTIPDNAFNAPILKILYLSNNALIDIHENAFINAPNTGVIHLKNNRLATLYENAFLSLKRHDLIFISENNWSCNCTIHFLTTIYKSIYDLDNTTCNDGTRLKEIFKGCTSTESTSVSISSSRSIATSEVTIITTTTVLTPTLVSKTSNTLHETSIPSKQSSPTESLPTQVSKTSNTFEETSIPSKQSSPTESLPTQVSKTSNTFEETSIPSTQSLPTESPPTQMCSTIEIDKFNVEETENEVQILYKGNVISGERILLLTSDHKACDLEGKKGIISKESTSYIMCKQSNNGDLECYAGKSMPAYDKQTWLNNSDKIHAFLIGSAVAVATSILSGIGVFYYIRKHPKLLKGNRRIAFVRTPPNDLVILPPKPRTPVYLMPYPNESSYFQEVSCRPVRDAPYLTPISQRYLKVQENYKRPGLKRSLSDLSMKTVASYVTENQLMFGSSLNRRPIIDDPPPLPPPRNRYEEVFVHERDFRNRSAQY